MRLWNATRWSFAGLRAAGKYEAAFRADALLAVTLFGVSFFVAENAIEWAILVAPLLLTMIVELLNSAIETTVDRIGVERIPMVRELFRNLVTAEGTRAIREWDEMLSVFEVEQRESADNARKNSGRNRFRNDRFGYVATCQRPAAVRRHL